MLRFCAILTAVIVVAPLLGDDTQWTTIKGQIVYEGELKESPPLNITVDQTHCLEKGKILNETWIINKSNRGIKNAFVWLASDAATASGKDLPIHSSLKDVKSNRVEMDQPNCAFVPHAVGVREGQALLVKNSSPITHNVRWEPANT